MFPYFENKISFDEYGEVIRPQDYVIAEEDQEMEENTEEPIEKWEEEVYDIYLRLTNSCFKFFLF